MLEVTIDREKWNRAIPKVEYQQHFGKAKLLNEQGNMCCLGFVCKATGLSDQDIMMRSYPQSTFLSIDKLTTFSHPDISYPKDTALSCRAASINDNQSIPQKAKEKMLKDLFLENDIKLKFVGRTPKLERTK